MLPQRFHNAPPATVAVRFFYINPKIIMIIIMQYIFVRNTVCDSIRMTADDADQPLKLRRDGDYVQSAFYLIHRYIGGYRWVLIMHKINYLLFFYLSFVCFFVRGNNVRACDKFERCTNMCSLKTHVYIIITIPFYFPLGARRRLKRALKQQLQFGGDN